MQKAISWRPRLQGGAHQGCFLCGNVLVPRAAWLGVTMGEAGVWDPSLAREVRTWWRGQAKGKIGSLLFFLPTHGLSNMVDVSPCNCEVSPGFHRQHSGIQHLNPSSSQVYLETVYWRISKARTELKATLVQGKERNTRNLPTSSLFTLPRQDWLIYPSH